jgi:hypothetical protein
MLVGRWRITKIARVIDGRPPANQVTDGKTIIEFRQDGSWTTISAPNPSAGRYKWIDADSIEQTTLESGLANLIGQATTRRVRVTGSSLELTQIQKKQDMEKFLPPPKPGEIRPNEIVVVFTFARIVAE